MVLVQFSKSSERRINVRKWNYKVVMEMSSKEVKRFKECFGWKWSRITRV